jgi:hypothetical protein
MQVGKFVQALCRLCADSVQILPGPFLFYSAHRPEKCNSPAFLCSFLLELEAGGLNPHLRVAKKCWGVRKEEAGCRGRGPQSWEKARNGQNRAWEQFFPGGEDASVEFFVQDALRVAAGADDAAKDLIRLPRGADPFM